MTSIKVPRRGAALAVLCLAAFTINLDTTIVNVALPSLVRELGATTSELQWVVAAYLLTFAALVLASLGFGFKPRPYDLILMGFVTVFSLVSVSLYLVEWVRHMSTIEAN